MFRSYPSVRYCRVQLYCGSHSFRRNSSSLWNCWSSCTVSNCIASVRFASDIRTPRTSFRLREMMRFLQLEPFAVDPNKPRDTCIPKVIQNQEGNDVKNTAGIVEEACWLCYVAAMGLPRDTDNSSNSLPRDVVVTEVANRVIEFYDRHNGNNNVDFTLGGVTQPWQDWFCGIAAPFMKIIQFSFFLSVNSTNLRRLLCSCDQINLLSVSQMRSDKSMTDGNLKNFYKDRSVVVMSSWLSEYTARRFVAPSSTLHVQLTPTKPATPKPQSDLVNIVGGWSGTGKSCAATLPSSSFFGPIVPPICVVVSAKEIFSDLDGSNKQEITASTTFTPMKYAEFEKQGDTNKRDDLTASLLVSGILNAFGRSDCSAKARGIAMTTWQFTVGRLPDFVNFFEPGVEDNLAGQINQHFSGNNEFRFVLDDAGDCLDFVGTACKIWLQFRSFLQRVFRIDNIDKIFFYVVGSGSEFVGHANSGSYPCDYAIFFVRPNLFFGALLHTQANSSATVKKPEEVARQELYRKIFDMLLEFDNGVLRARVSTHAARTFLHLVSDNARCAALGMRLISRFVHDHTSFDHMTSRFSTWSADISAEFVRLNGLSSSDHPFVEIGKALRIVMSRTHADLTRDEIHAYLVHFGILVDTKLPTISVVAARPTPPIRPRYRIQQSLVTMFLLHKKLEFSNDLLDPNESFKHLVANHHALCLVLQPILTCGNSPASLKLFESITTVPKASVETIALRVRLTDGVSAMEAKAILKKKNPHPLLASNQAQLIRTFGDAAKKWKDTVANGGAVVIINGPEAPFADVIVLTDGKLFLTQCKYYQPTTKLAEGPVKEELDTMLTSPQNVFTRTLLRECCAVGSRKKNADDVEVVASTVVFFKETNQWVLKANSSGGFEWCSSKRQDTVKDGSWNAKWMVRKTTNVGRAKQSTTKKTSTVINTAFRENFKYSKRVICTFMNSDNVTAGRSLAIDLANDGTNSELYPLLFSALDQAHLVDAHKGLIVESKTRPIVDV